MNQLSNEELTILYTALVNYTTNELREVLREGGHHELAERISPLGMAFLGLKITAIKEDN